MHIQVCYIRIYVQISKYDFIKICTCTTHLYIQIHIHIYECVFEKFISQSVRILAKDITEVLLSHVDIKNLLPFVLFLCFPEK